MADGAVLALAAVAVALGLAGGWWVPDLARWLDARWELGDDGAERTAPPPTWHRAVLALTTGMAAAGVAHSTGPGLALPAAFAALGWLCVIAAIDLRTRIIPNRLTYPAILAAPILVVVWPQVSIMERLAGAALCAGFFLLAFLVSRGALGLGDVKLTLVLGLYLGLERGVVALVSGLALGGIAAVVALSAGMGRKDAIPYGPSLCAGGAVALCAGDALWRAYLAHVGIL